MTHRILLILATSVHCLLGTANLAFAKPAPSDTKKPGIKVMTYNVLYGGTRRGQPLSQTAKAIQAAGADIVGLQEIGDNTKKLADLLGWKYLRHGSAAIMTRFEIVENYNERTKSRLRSGGAKIRLDSGQEVYVFNAHFTPYPYQPYQLLGIGKDTTIKTEAEAIAAADKTGDTSSRICWKQSASSTTKTCPSLSPAISMNHRISIGQRLRRSQGVTQSNWPIRAPRRWRKMVFWMLGGCSTQMK